MKPFIIKRRNLFNRIIRLPKMIIGLWKLNKDANLKDRVFFICGMCKIVLKK